MLRVRPALHTPAFSETVALLALLGLRCVKNDADYALFDSGHGKVQVLRAAGGLARVDLAFELRDAAIFVQRTLADGTPAALIGDDAVVSAPDGFSFAASPVTDLALADPGSAWAVVATWRSPSPAAANQTLLNIGAKMAGERPGSGALFRTKNGGFVRTAKGAGNAVELGLAHRGELSELAARLGAAGVSALEKTDRLIVAVPGGGELSVSSWPISDEFRGGETASGPFMR